MTDKEPHLSPEHQMMIGELQRQGRPVTRENYCNLMWLGEKPDPWTPEHEAELPEHLQDWSQFEKK